MRFIIAAQRRSRSRYLFIGSADRFRQIVVVGGRRYLIKLLRLLTSRKSLTYIGASACRSDAKPRSSGTRGGSSVSAHVSSGVVGQLASQHIRIDYAE
jgi:hypothetical protein